MPPFELLPGGADLLDSALAAPRWSYHANIHSKAAALFRSIVKNHALKDGNKRLGVVALDTFLRVNRVDLKVSQENLVDAALAIASYPGNFPLEWLTGWIRAGCSGRPRRMVQIAADSWPKDRAFLAAAVRVTDKAAGKGPRVPGKRVRFPPTFWEEVARAVAELPAAEQQLMFGPEAPANSVKRVAAPRR